jgi:hypothetical protein
MIIFVAFFVLFANEGKALQAESICCEEIESLLKNKTTAYQTVCLGPERELSSSCCRNIEIEIEKHRFAYRALCPAVEKLVTTPLTTPLTTTTATTTRIPTTGMFVSGLW